MSKEKVKPTKKAKVSVKGNLKERLEMLFLHTMFGNVDFLKGEIAKHFDILESNILLKTDKVVSDGENNELSRICNLSILDNKFSLRFDKKIDPPKKIKVPKVVKLPRKWYQSEASTSVIVEEKETKPYAYWVLISIK